MVALVITPFTAKKLVLVLLVEDAFVVEAVVATSVFTVREVAVVVASVEVPTTVKVPCEVIEEVAVMFPAVKVLIVAVNAERIVEKNDVVVAFVAVN